jgi:transcription-repair coupling factor (superfamily II helicase)
MALRLQLYRRIGNLQTSEEISQLDAEMRDRFGPLPDAVEGLLYQMRVKLLAAAVGATAILKPRKEILIKLPWLASVRRELLAVQLGQDVEVSRTAVELAYDPLTWRERLLALMTEIKGDMPVFARPGAQKPKSKTKEKA